MFAQKLSLRTSFSESGIAVGFLERLISPENFTDLCPEKGELCRHVLGNHSKVFLGTPGVLRRYFMDLPHRGCLCLRDVRKSPGGWVSKSFTLCFHQHPSALNYYIIEILLLSSLGKKNTISKCFGNHSHRFSQI